MTWLSKNDWKKFICISIVLIIFSICVSSYIQIESSFLVEFSSIMIGFLFSTIAILYSSNLRFELYQNRPTHYNSYWEMLVSYYRFACFYFVLSLLVVFLKISIINAETYNIIYLILVLMGIMILGEVMRIFFKLLLIRIN